MARDGTDLGYLNPGMPERLGFAWEQLGNTVVPATVDVEIYNETLRPTSLGGDVGGGNLGWFDPAVRATVRAPVTVVHS